MDVKRVKQDMEKIDDQLRGKEEQTDSLKRSIQKLRKDLKELSEKRSEDRHKLDDMRAKYMNLCNKARQGGLREAEIPDADDNSQSFRITKNPHVPEDPVIQAAMRAPVAKQLGSVKFGGFKKPGQ